MQQLDQIYIDGAFVEPHGQERFALHNPATGAIIGSVRLGDETDAQQAIAAAKAAFARYRWSRKTERIELLRALHAAVAARVQDLSAVTTLEYGAPLQRARTASQYAADSFLRAAETLEAYPLERTVGASRVVMEPVGVSALITPWNANAGFICNKLAYALAAGCAAVIKPSEMSGLQTQVVMEALHEAGLPRGLYNIVTGRGDTVGAEFSRHPDVAKVSFTGSTAVGKMIMRTGAETLKRVTLELGGKSPFIVLDDADFATAAPLALAAGFMNSGQACLAGTRILAPRARLAEFETAILAALKDFAAGDPSAPSTRIGPMVSQTQWERVQGYIEKGVEDGASLLAGGPGRPEGLPGWFVKPTIFTDVKNTATIAREEIFGPVLAIIPYEDDEDAIALANDSDYGLHGYVVSADPARAQAIARRLEVGRVMINGLHDDPLAPFGGVKQSGLGREFGSFGLEAYLEPKTLMGA